MTYYFAYGSCMHEQDFQRTVAIYDKLGRAKLFGYRLGFTLFNERRRGGVADILSDSDSVVEGILYRISDDAVRRLDIREGHPNVYEQKRIQIVYNGDIIHNVLTYTVKHPSEIEFAPGEHYLSLILEAAKHDLSKVYLNKIQAHVESLRR